MSRIYKSGTYYAGSLPEGGNTGQALVKSSNLDGDVEWGSVEGSLPAGGTIGQVLTKHSSTDGDADWEDVDALPSGGTLGQALIKQSSSDGDAAWEDIDALPSGGTTGQVLTKKSNSDGDAEWGTPLSLGESETTAYRGDRGKTAYDDSQANKTAIGVLANLLTTAKNNLVSAINELVSGKQNSLSVGSGIAISNDEISVKEMAAGDMSEIIDPKPLVMSRRFKYSTEEQVVGEWIDGKPLYQKTFTGTLTSSLVQINIGSEKNVKEFKGYAKWVDGSYSGYCDISSSGPGVNSGTIEALLRAFTQEPDSLYIQKNGALFNNQEYCITIKYTKTTD